MRLIVAGMTLEVGTYGQEEHTEVTKHFTRDGQVGSGNEKRVIFPGSRQSRAQVIRSRT